ncbi:hypothetical protein D3C81_1536300 [compost metagenome]
MFQRQVQAVGAVTGEADAVTQFLQTVEQVIAGLGFVFDNQNIHRSVSMVIDATAALYLIVQHMFAALMVEVIQLRRDHATRL